MLVELNDFRPIGLADKPQFDSLLNEYPPEISEHTFTNIFIWREYYGFSWSRIDDWILIKALDEVGKPYFWPPIGGGDATEILAACIESLERLDAGQARVLRVPKGMTLGLDAFGLAAVPDRNQFDYVYRTKDLIELRGREFHAKKNHLNKFRKSYSWSYENISPDKVPECLDMETDWCHMKSCHSSPTLTVEEQAIWEALTNMKALNFVGGAIRVDGVIEAFTLGEKLNDTTAVIHIEKANPQIDGLYVAINQAFVENELSQFEFINREQDLGIHGLRKAKESYNPIGMVEKFSIYRA